VNFGLLYGMGAEGLRRYARSQYGVTLTPAEAKQYRDAFFRAFPGLARWHHRTRQGKAMETRTLAGRRRLLDGETHDTHRLNTPVQGTGADGLKRALALLWERRGDAPGAVPVIACHDEIVVECEAEDAEAVAAWLAQAMRDGMAPLIEPVPVDVEVTRGQTWAG
jgi:DNA polymerase I